MFAVSHLFEFSVEILFLLYVACELFFHTNEWWRSWWSL